MRRPLRRGVATAFTCVVALALLVPGSASATHPKGDPRLQVVHAFSSAETAGAIATATATCPQTTRPDLGPWRAISGGFSMTGVVPGSVPPGFGPPPPPTGSGVVYECRARSANALGALRLRASGARSPSRYPCFARTACQKRRTPARRSPRPGRRRSAPRRWRAAAPARRSRAASRLAAIHGQRRGQHGDRLVAQREKGWEAQVPSSQASSLTSYVYCAKRKPVRLRHSSAGEPSSVATLDLSQAVGNIYECPVVGKFVPGGGEFSRRA